MPATAAALPSMIAAATPGVTMPACAPALDANNDGRYDVSDPVFLLNFLFGHGDIIDAPYTGIPALCP